MDRLLQVKEKQKEEDPKMLNSSQTHKQQNGSNPQTTSQQESKPPVFLVLMFCVVLSTCLFPVFAPIFIGAALFHVINCIDEALKKSWGLKYGKWSMPASLLWCFVSSAEVVFCMGVGLVSWVDNRVYWSPLWISFIVYIPLSVLILIRRYIAVLKKQGIPERQERESSSQKKQPRPSTVFTSTFKHEQTHFDTQTYFDTIEDDGDIDEDDVDDDDYTDPDKANTKVLCEKLSKSIQVDMAFWSEMHLDFKCNLVASYTSLQLNFEIKNDSGVPWSNGGGGITLKANFYDKNGNLIHIDDTYIEDKVLVKNRFSDYLYFDYDDISKAVSLQLYAYQDK